MIGELHHRPRSREFCHFLDTVDRNTPPELSLHLILFALLNVRQRARGEFPSTRALENAITAYIAATNADPKPFVWTKTADEILASVARYCPRFNDSHH